MSNLEGDMHECPERIWIEQDECPYFYEESELAEVGSPVTEYIRADLCHRPAPAATDTGLETVAYQYKFRDVWLVSDAPKVMRKDDYELRELVTRQNAEEVIAAERMKLEATAKVGLQLSEKIEALEADNKRLREALEVMLVPYEGSDCRRDHHGYCQEHFLEEDCCVAKARATLGEVKP